MIGAVTRNLGWKLASLAASFVLWMILSGSRESTTSLTAPVQYRNIPKNLEISSEMIEEVHLILRGPSVKLTRLGRSDVPLVLDLSRVRAPGETTFTVNQDEIELPAGVALERAIPGQIRLRLETRVARNVPIKVRFANLPDGMRVTEQEVSPPGLTVIGPESRVSKIEFVEVDPVDLRLLDAEGRATTTAFVGDPHVLFTSSPAVTVRVHLAPIEAPEEPAKKK